MFARQLIRKRGFLHLRVTCITRKSSQQATQVMEMYLHENKLPPHAKKKPQREPFAKNLFIGKCDTEFFAFPEPGSMERHKQFFQWLKPIEGYISHCAANENLNKEEVLSQLQKLDVLHGAVHEDYRGLNLSNTELLKLLETVNQVPWLGTYLVKNNILPVQVISKYGTQGQQQRYLPKIVSGEIVPTLCFYENDTCSNVQDIETEAVISKGDHYVLNGRKTLVFNALNSNLLLVFANCKDYDVRSKKTLSLLLVESDSEGVNCTDVQSTIGRQHTPMCTVTFKNTIVPKQNIVGEVGTGFDILMELIRPGNQNIAAQAITILRQFNDMLLSHVVNRTHFDRNFYELDNVKRLVGGITSSLYCMESAAYLTAAIADEFEDQDVSLEKAITETYCANECMKNIALGLQLIGTHSALSKYPYMQTFEDALSLIMLDGMILDANVYIPTTGIQYAGKDSYKNVQKLRNPLLYPMFYIKYGSLAKFKNKLDLYGYLHPSMKPGADALEKSIDYLQRVLLALFIAHGTDISQRYIDLCRLSEIVTNQYISVAAMARASRSYCIGFANAEQERNLAVNVALLAETRNTVIIDEIGKDDLMNGDKLYKTLADFVYQKKRYSFEHALKRLD